MDPPSITERAERPYIQQGTCPIPTQYRNLCLTRTGALRPTPAAKTPKSIRHLPGSRASCSASVLWASTDASTQPETRTTNFSIMSVSKPFVFGLICEGPDTARDKLGGNATGLAFNCLAAIDQGPGGRTNPMVNAGAVAAKRDGSHDRDTAAGDGSRAREYGG